MQLKCTWSGISPKLWFYCRRIGLALSASRVPPQKCPFAWRDLDSHLIIHGSLGPAESTAQTTSRSVQLFLQGSRSTDRPRKSICNNRLHLHSSEMRPNNKLCNIVARDDTNQWHSISEIYSVRLYQSMNFLNTPHICHPVACCTSVRGMITNCRTAVLNKWRPEPTEMRLLNTPTKQHVTLICMYNTGLHNSTIL